MLSANIRKQINRLLRSKTPFAVVRMSAREPLVILPDSSERFEITTWNNQTIAINGYVDSKNESYDIPKPTSDQEHISRVEELVDILKKRGGKTVLSRILELKCSDIDWAQTASTLWDEYPDVFGFLFYTPLTGAWLGATPERLLIADSDGKFATDALAGTVEKDADWDEKNINEHNIVVDYIGNVLAMHDLAFVKHPTREIYYSNIKHLCTSFEGEGLDDTKRRLLLSDLAPTPALAGFPKDDALNEIARFESHNRGCYGGYITFCDSSGVYSFVTIRCVQFDPATGRGAIYVGGGITAQSDPVEESKETYRKAASLLKISNK